MNIVTIGQVAIAINPPDTGGMENIIYCGLLEGLRTHHCEKFAPLHPKAITYFHDNLMVLWKMRGTPKGTECPLSSVLSYLPKHVDGNTYIAVWRPLDN